MKSIVVYLNSSVAGAVIATPEVKFNELRQLTRKETVELVFKDNWCRIVARHSRKVKVPQKAIASSEGLVKWIEEKIKSAWK